MARANFFIVQNNTAPAYEITCQRDGVDIDLSSATVELILQEKSSGDITNVGHQTCTVTDATGGVISYAAESTDFPNKGRYVGDIKVTYGGGGVEILYNQAAWQVRNKIA